MLFFVLGNYSELECFQGWIYAEFAPLTQYCVSVSLSQKKKKRKKKEKDIDQKVSRLLFKNITFIIRLFMIIS